MSNPNEKIILVDGSGTVTRFSQGKDLADNEFRAVVLILVYLPATGHLMLFNRGAGAADMHDHWALTAGKINEVDGGRESELLVGHPLPLTVARSAAAREFEEELGVVVDPTTFLEIDEFTLPDKKIRFYFLGWRLSGIEVGAFIPDGHEVDHYKLFSLDEFKTAPNLGDAIQYRKGEIVEFLIAEFAI